MNPVEDAIAIWKAGVAAVEPHTTVRTAVKLLLDGYEYKPHFQNASAIQVVGAGKAGAKMSLGLEESLTDYLEKITGLVNVPEGCTETPVKIRLQPARPAASNFPTQAGVDGANQMLRLLNGAQSNDLAICLISGGGSALLPAPVEGVTLEEKRIMTQLLHSCGATIREMNCVRKHLSRIKGGQLAQAFRGSLLLSFIISDVLEDDLSVIASGPTVADSTTFTNALEVIKKYRLQAHTPASIIKYLEAGHRGQVPETPKQLSNRTINYFLANYTSAAGSAWGEANRIGYRAYHAATKENPNYHCLTVSGTAAQAMKPLIRIIVECRKRPHRLGQFILRQIGFNHLPAIIFGGETTVTLGPNPGKGGRNQEFVLAMLCELGEEGMKGVTILCAGTDGEDGPTDAAGAIGTRETLQRAMSLGLNPRDFLDRHDSYHFFETTGSLFKTGLTGTNVMDLGVILLT